LLTLYGSSDYPEEEKISRVTDLFIRLNIPDFIKGLRNQYQQEAYDHLQRVQAPTEAKKILFDLAESLLVREL
jgi:geranylgeranyl diphosphate synthase, type II